MYALDGFAIDQIKSAACEPIPMLPAGLIERSCMAGAGNYEDQQEEDLSATAADHIHAIASCSMRLRILGTVDLKEEMG